MGSRRTRGSMDGSRAMSWSSDEGGCRAIQSSFLVCAGLGCHYLLERGSQPSAKQWVGAKFSAIQGDGGESAECDARRDRRTSSGGRWIRDFGGSCFGSLPARVLPGKVSGERNPSWRIGCTSKRTSYGLVRRSGCRPVWISGVDLEWTAGSGPTGPTGRQVEQPSEARWLQCSGDFRIRPVCEDRGSGGANNLGSGSPNSPRRRVFVFTGAGPG